MPPRYRPRRCAHGAPVASVGHLGLTHAWGHGLSMTWPWSCACLMLTQGTSRNSATMVWWISTLKKRFAELYPDVLLRTPRAPFGKAPPSVAELDRCGMDRSGGTANLQRCVAPEVRHKFPHRVIRLCPKPCCGVPRTRGSVSHPNMVAITLSGSSRHGEARLGCGGGIPHRRARLCAAHCACLRVV